MFHFYQAIRLAISPATRTDAATLTAAHQALLNNYSLSLRISESLAITLDGSKAFFSLNDRQVLAVLKFSAGCKAIKSFMMRQHIIEAYEVEYFKLNPNNLLTLTSLGSIKTGYQNV